MKLIFLVFTYVVSMIASESQYVLSGDQDLQRSMPVRVLSGFNIDIQSPDPADIEPELIQLPAVLQLSTDENVVLDQESELLKPPAMTEQKERAESVQGQEVRQIEECTQLRLRLRPLLDQLSSHKCLGSPKS